MRSTCQLSSNLLNEVSSLFWYFEVAYACDIVVKSSRLLSYHLMNSCFIFIFALLLPDLNTLSSYAVYGKKELKL